MHKYHASVTDALRGFEGQVCGRSFSIVPVTSYYILRDV